MTHFICICNILIYILLPITIDGEISEWSKRIDQTNVHTYSVFPNSMYKGSSVDVTIVCTSTSRASGKIQVEWIFQELECMEELFSTQTQIQAKDSVLAQLNYDLLRETDRLPSHGHRPIKRKVVPRKDLPTNMTNGSIDHVDHPENAPTPSSADPRGQHVIKFQISQPQVYECSHNNIIHLKDESATQYYIGALRSDLPQDSSDRFTWKAKISPWTKLTQNSGHAVKAWENGMYHFMMNIRPAMESFNFNASVRVTMKSDSGFLPAIQWPLLPVRGVLAFLYLAFGTAWVFLWAFSHQHTLKIHIVIGLVAVAAAMANVLSFVELSTSNATGNGVVGLKWLSLFLTVIQNCLIQLVLMIVSTGYGITRPELNRTLLVAAMFLSSLAAITNFLSFVVLDEDLKIKYNMPWVALAVNLVYGVIMLILGAWIMVFSIITFVHLCKRKHSAKKVTSFTIFTVTCVCIFIANLALTFLGVGFTRACAKDWRLEWLFTSFGSMTSLVLLVVLMWLWRPLDQAQSYAFTPLSTDEKILMDEDSDEDVTVFDKVALQPLGS